MRVFRNNKSDVQFVQSQQTYALLGKISESGNLHNSVCNSLDFGDLGKRFQKRSWSLRSVMIQPRVDRPKLGIRVARCLCPPEFCPEVVVNYPGFAKLLK